MKANLNLVVNNTLLSEKTDGVAEGGKVQSINNLVPKRQLLSEEMKNETPSYKMLALIMLVHLFGISALFEVKPEQVKVDDFQTPMLVSLVSNPRATSEVVPIQSVASVPIKHKKQTVEKQKLPMVEKDIKETSMQTQVNKEKLPVETDAESEIVAARIAISTETLAEVTSVKPEAEQEVEPPRFGAAYLNNPAPAYPPLARRLSEQGRVLLKVLVTEEGLASIVQVDTSSGYNKLDQAAIEAVKKWSFIPAKRSNQPISAYVLVPIKFSLNS
ncbi:energy transducer TonB [Methylotenera sp.]|uniref:energy transducer TonB n=1 Tax=Methylotenera sp. TaxID=2051956 RepID=UPI00272566C7|nr:energy transducer TonB [Methylotenera sp.]MDO9203834.1 energy transducer TonB [Methylotenera sp.]MDP2070628.1 energy transducer TonB [Methylotenera sp.]MDP2231288.1 energy transducer TonB [Methylotenera sp.]MDP3004891.1 energy transducer TonB [Methylotenera sp.]MDP3140346.1 energy transducer TonB [Methylotenera sp.]